MEQALPAAVFLVAFLYSSVGHGGASGYLAVMTLYGVALSQAAVGALALNILVAGTAFLAFRRAGHFEARLFWPFAATSVPFALLGGLLSVPFRLHSLLLALALAWAAFRLMAGASEAPSLTRPPWPGALGAGAGIGLLSGLVGVGGGIFLSPLLILMRWATARTAAAVSALFIVVNSASGLVGHLARGAPVLQAWPLAAAAFAGGLAGSHLGARRFDNPSLRRLLAFVLLFAAVKLLLVARR